MLLAAGVLVWIGLYAVWSLRTEVNWDEFALLARTSDSLREGRVLGAGRPGLATIVLMPIVQGCTDSLAAVRLARLAWMPFSVGIIFGLWLVLRRLLADRRHASLYALTGVALLVATPEFMRFGIQVRTDQPAIAMGLIAGATLLAPRRGFPASVAAGLFLGVGYLFSQKLIYVAALVGLLAAADLLLKSDLDGRRDIARILAVAGSFSFVLVSYRFVTSLMWEPAETINLERQMDVFRYYRESIGYYYYRRMLPYILGPLGLLALLASQVPGALLRGGRDRHLAALAIVVLALGIGVVVFHAGAFPYFWMTLGLFPAVALAIGFPLLLRLPKLAKRVLLPVLGAVFLITAVNAGVSQVDDKQATQRETMAFASNLPADVEGFHPTRALFCRERRDPLPTFFSQTIEFRLKDDEEAIQGLITEFRRRPIGFIVATHRLALFPERIRSFWREHYTPYTGAVHLAGTTLDESPVPAGFDVVLPGRYAFHAKDPESQIRIGDVDLRPGDTIFLGGGMHSVEQAGIRGSGILALSVPTPPGPAGDEFYSMF